MVGLEDSEEISLDTEQFFYKEHEHEMAEWEEILKSSG